MQKTFLPPVSIPAEHHVRLRRLTREAMRELHPVSELLWAELNRAVVTMQPEPDVVVLGCFVTYRADLGWPRERRLLVCPEDYRDPRSHLSVLSPLGAALIGLMVGSRFPYRSVEGLLHIATVEDVEGPDDGPPPFAA
jgi:regulator of nucleoside diphosphate kinase